MRVASLVCVIVAGAARSTAAAQEAATPETSEPAPVAEPAVAEAAVTPAPAPADAPAPAGAPAPAVAPAAEPEALRDDAARAALSARDAAIREFGRREGYAEALRQAALQASERARLAHAGVTRIDTGPASPVELPRDERFTVAVVEDLMLRSDRGYDAYVEEDTNVTERGGLAARYTVARLPGGLALSGELSWSVEVLDAMAPTDLRNRLISHAFTVGARAQQALTSWLRPQARLGAGVEYSLISLEQPSGPRLEGDGVDLFAVAGLGAAVRTPSGYFSSLSGSFGLGLSVEAGYVLSSRLGVLVEPPEPDDDEEAADRIPVRRENLGSLVRSAPYLRLAAEMYL